MNKTKVRSPNYPAISLEEAITKTKLIYDQEHKNPTDKEVIANHLGYTGMNGTSLAVISALTKYGLLEPTGPKQLRVSESAEDIFYLKPEDSSRIELLREAAFAPSLFAELRDAFPEKVPSDHSLRFYLIKKDFNPRVVDSVIRTYRDTLEFITQEEAINANTLDKEEETQQEPILHQSSREAYSLGLSNSNIYLPTPAQASASRPGTSTEELLIEETLQYRISEDCTARIQFTGVVTREGIKKLIALLQLNADVYPTKKGQRPSVTEVSSEQTEYWQPEDSSDDNESIENDD